MKILENGKMIFHHIGLAVRDIDKSMAEFNNLIKLVSKKIYDPLQDVELQLIDFSGALLELVSGRKVDNFIKKGVSYYHLCFEVENLDETMKEFKGKGVFLSEPVPAVLFNNRRIVSAFLKELGLVEFLERE